jgi:hypothetical protein
MLAGPAAVTPKILQFRYKCIWPCEPDARDSQGRCADQLTHRVHFAPVITTGHARAAGNEAQAKREVLPLISGCRVSSVSSTVVRDAQD